MPAIALPPPGRDAWFYIGNCLLSVGFRRIMCPLQYKKRPLPNGSMAVGAQYRFYDIKTMGKQQDHEARALLEKAVQQVLPVMAKRKWKVDLLTEFFPSAY